MQDQEPVVQMEHKTGEVWQMSVCDEVVDIPVVVQRQACMEQKISRMLDLSAVQYIEKGRYAWRAGCPSARCGDANRLAEF